MTAWQSWTRLYNFFDFLELQGDITVEAHESIVDTLETFKLFAIECEEKENKEE
jgi:hypothetical protein